ncbi:MAG TPA: asparagine synthase (glutamine-hydrolyzing) [Bryobacteraceae bacterium]|nr:asparagine synthase (glutamine-hydrolyzing) [Bryobacteraceae bacterium]
MCGIAGFTTRRGIAHPGRIQDAVESILHRGPDQQGVYQSPNVLLGAARLKIVDLQGGDQPIQDTQSGTVIVFNGEIYNHLELRGELERRGRRFHSHSDTETVLQAFLEWDTECFARMRGMFAVALWSEPAQRLVLARDRMGIKPLYFAQRGEDIYFGSELKTILVHPEIDRTLSLDGLDCYLSLNYVPAPWTLVEGIYKLLPGHWLEWQDGAVRTERYWRLPLPEERLWDARAAQEELDRLLRQSVSEHLLSDVPLGVWLSGGIDSSTLLHYAAEASSSPVQTFSISFRGRSFDETPYIRSLAQCYSSAHYELDMSAEQDLAGVIEAFAYYSDEPNADAGAVPVWLLSKLTKRHATVALSGEGADELFGGYLTHRASMLARRVRRLPGKTLDLAEAIVRHWPVSDEKIGFEYKAKRFLAGCRMRPERAHVYWNGTFSRAEKRGLVSRALPGSLDAMLGELAAAGDNLPAYLWFDQRYYLPDDILTKVDRISMAHSIEVRPPFLDHRIVEFAASLPADMRIRGSRQKVILKELMRGKLPPAILSRKKVGFDVPAHEWFRGPLRPLLEETIARAAGSYSAIFRFDKIDALAQAHWQRRANLGYHLWGLLTLFLWMKRWRIQMAPLEEAARIPEQVFSSS